ADPKPRLGGEYKLPVIFAGNRDARGRIEEILGDRTALVMTDNIRPVLPPFTAPSRGPRHEWTLHPLVQLAGSAGNQMPTFVFSSLRNVPSGKYLSVQNGVVTLAATQTMEFRFEPRVQSKVLTYQREIAIAGRSGRYLTARLGQLPVLVLSDRPSFEWIILGSQAGAPVPVDATVALGNSNQRNDELVYCPGTPGGLEVSWNRLCPPAPSAPGEQPAPVTPTNP
ncbi:MAG: glutamate mutase L, partial [Acidobacteria bacterium]|nr:glutamate mutase L [Acidobacteriota bacterium]